MLKDRYGLVPSNIKAQYEMEAMVDREVGMARALDRALKEKDHRLSVVLAKEKAPAHYGIKPGYWHVVRDNEPPAAPTYWPIQDRSGAPAEPGYWVLEELDRRDTWNRDILPKFRKTTVQGIDTVVPADEDPAVKERERKREQMKDEIKSDLEAGRRVAGEGGLHKRKWGRG